MTSPSRNQLGSYRTVAVDGIEFVISATGQTGINTERQRYRVYCLRCEQEVHPATTGPENWAKSHVRNEHGGAP